MDTSSQNSVYSSSVGSSSGICYNITANAKVLSYNEIEKLNYEIYRYSSFSTNYFPENILVDCPSDQSSHWSAQTNNPPQYLTIRLRRPAIVKSIKFGKFEKSHVCNVKKFRVYGGLEEEHMVLLLEGGLKNDNKPETFSLRCVTEDGSENLPILFIKIVPLLSWGPTFNFSIWYIELHGQDDPMFTSASMKSYNMLRETEIIRLCLKHFRQQGYEAAFRALQEQTQVRLEHPLISELHQHLVINGDFERSEQITEDFVNKGLMDEYLKHQDYRHAWCVQELTGTEQPGNRGGHQLVMDTQRRLIYLYGGWDGYQDLSDLWVFDIIKNMWKQLFAHTEEFKGPTPRSCHKMVFDPVSGNIFMIGRYLDNSIRTTDYIKSDFFLFDTRLNTWLQICDDTSQVGGPQLVYDHQMCIDVEKRTIFVFGGKILTPRSVTTATTTEPEYSGLFSYHIDTNTWHQIMVDCHHPSAAKPDVLSIKSRVTHCMVFHTKNRKLYIYGGNRGKDDIEDFITYEVDTQAIAVINKDLCRNAIGETEPSPGYTLRATIDCDRDEIYVFSSLSKLKDRRDIQSVDPSNSFWVYSLQKNEWTRIYNCRHNSDSPNAIDKLDALEPCPRFAHQLVYDDVAKLHYLFGGNPGRSNLPQLRLDDFWILQLEKPKREELLTDCRYLVRKLCYEEMARIDKLKAMEYLRTHIAEVIDHSDQDQLNNFHKLAYLLFKPEDGDFGCAMLDTPALGALSPDMELASKPREEVPCATLASPNDEDSLPKTDSDTTNPADDISLESNESTAPPSTTASASNTDAAAYKRYHKSGGKRSYQDFVQEIKSRRVFLFNKLVRLMPANMVQPERNLSDFVVM